MQHEDEPEDLLEYPAEQEDEENDDNSEEQEEYVPVPIISEPRRSSMKPQRNIPLSSAKQRTGKEHSKSREVSVKPAPENVETQPVGTCSPPPSIKKLRNFRFMQFC